MDSDDQKKEQQAAEVRNRRLLYLQRAEEVAEVAEVAAVHVNEAEQHELLQEQSGVPIPIASSTLISPVGPAVPLPLPVPASTAINADSSSAAIFLINGSGVQDLLQSIQQLLTQNAATARLPRQEDVTPVVPATAGGFASAIAPAVPSTSAYPRRRPSPKKPLPGLANDISGRVHVVSDSSETESDDVQEQKPATRQLQPRAPLPSDWRHNLPSTSRAGFGDEKPPHLKKRGPGRPKGSRNKVSKALESIDLGSAEDDPPIISESDSDTERRLFKRSKLEKSNWRESLPSTSACRAAGVVARKSASTTTTKRRPGRPKGAKNKSKVETCASDTSGLACHICREGREGGAYCLTDCGHLFHKKCLDRWIATSSQKYRTLKTCPYCGGNFQSNIPFFG